MSSHRVQVLVIGGGINGAGIARDLALRGVSCALVERRELGSGTSWASSGMIHGGLRYLQKDPDVTRHSCVDSGAIQRIAPHLVFRIPFVMPVFAEDPIGPELVEIGLEMYDRYQPYKNGRPHTRLTRAQALRLEPSLSPRLECAFTLDEWGVDAARLTAANALDAAERGALLWTHVEVVELLREAGGRVAGARVRDRLCGDEWRIEADLVMNATGPWAPQLAALAGVEFRLRPAKGIHLVFERRVSQLAIYARGIDGRDMFTFPHEQNSMAGTTDDDFYGDLDRIDVTEDEIEYVLQAMERSIPAIRAHRVTHTIQGVRPTLYGFGQLEDELTRDYAVIDHAGDGAPGFWTIAGGKLASYRLMAQDASDRLCAALAVREACRTATTPLPGGDGTLDVLAVAQRFRTPVAAVLRLGFRHGTRTPDLLAPWTPEPADSAPPPPRIVCACEPVLDAELLHVAHRERVRTLEDCALRVRLGIGACQGAGCARGAAGLLGEALDWPAERSAREVERFAAERWRATAPTLGGRHLAAIEIHRYVHLGARGFLGRLRVDATTREDDGAENAEPPSLARGVRASGFRAGDEASRRGALQTLARWHREPDAGQPRAAAGARSAPEADGSGAGRHEPGSAPAVRPPAASGPAGRGRIVRAVVVGGGLAGCAAALELAARGARVELIRAAPGATALGWGTLDVAGATPLRRGGLPLHDAPGGPVLAPRRRVERAALGNAAHPYAKLWSAGAFDGEIEAARAALDGWLAPSGLRVTGNLEQTRWLVDVHGALRGADLAFSGAGDGDLAGAGELALVDVPGLAGYDARAALRTLAAELAAVTGAGRSLQMLRLELPPALQALAGTPARLARALEGPAAREALQPQLAGFAADGRLVLFPPILGLDAAARVRGWLRETIGCRVAELVGSPELALAGFRVDRALCEALVRAGVVLRTGTAQAVEAADGRAHAVRVASDGAVQTLSLDALVLATGRYVGGGVVERDGVLREPLLGLPLYDLGGRRLDGRTPRRSVRHDYEGEQPLFAVGVHGDERLRPLGADGAPRLENLFAAGELLGGFDPARERTGLGVALLTGRRAGAEAARC
ncbi:FAD-dependent oxidoreductase [Myxococcota bacterium]|nr:FAD-dependent oxidoreductase [Myxococcota bacterium]